MKLMGPQTNSNKRDLFKTHYNKTVKYQRLREDLKRAREKKFVTYKRIMLRLRVSLSEETLYARKAWDNIFKGLKFKKLPTRIFYTAKLFFRNAQPSETEPGRNRKYTQANHKH